MTYDPLTRLLHLSVAAGVTSQMLTSLVMIHPKPGRLPNEWYEIHETVGIALLGAVALYWLWVLTRALVRGEALRLFPWLSPRLLADLRDDVVETAKAAANLRLPAGAETRPLPGAIQGIGLLLALALAGSGTAIALATAPNGGLSTTFRAIKEVHEAMAPLMWAYLVAHPLLGVLHQIAGHRTLTRMFGFSRAS